MSFSHLPYCAFLELDCTFKLSSSLNDTIQIPKIEGSGSPEIKEQMSKHESQLDYKAIQKTLNIYDTFPDPGYMENSVKLSFPTVLGKIFHVDTFEWTVNDNRGFMYAYSVPYDLLINSLAKIPYISSCYWRGNVCVVLQISGTPMHQGTLVVSAVPHDTMKHQLGHLEAFNSLFASPHVLLSPNMATASCLDFPFYYPVQYAKTTLQESGYLSYSDSKYKNSGYLTFSVLNKLKGSDTSSTAVSVSISVMFKDLEFYVPKAVTSSFSQSKFKKIISDSVTGFFNGLKTTSGDLIDGAREIFRQYTGLHNPNLSVNEHSILSRPVNYHNSVEGPTYIERLDPFVNFDRMMTTPVFNTKVDEMFLPYVLSKPQFIDSFRVTSSMSKGTLVMSIPISPYQMIMGKGRRSSIQNNLYLCSKYWRGKIRFYIHSSMSNMHFAKLLCVKEYCNARQGPPPSIEDAVNLMSDSLEFNGGGRIAVVDCPYYQEKAQMVCSTDHYINGYQSGRFHVYLQQPLVLSGTTANEVVFNVFYSLHDFEFYGFNTNSRIPDVLHEDPLQDGVNVEFNNSPNFAQSSFTPYNINEQTALNTVMVENLTRDDHDMRPIVSIRDYIRRYQSEGINSSFAQLASIAKTMHPIIYSMYYGISGGFKLKFEIAPKYDVDPINEKAFPVRIIYEPPSATTDSNLFVVGDSSTSLYNRTGTMTSQYYLQDPRTRVFEFVVPCNTPFKFVRTYPQDSNTDSHLGKFLYVNAGGEIIDYQSILEYFYVKVFIAATDETRLGFLTRVSDHKNDAALPDSTYFGISDRPPNDPFPNTTFTKIYYFNA